MIETVRKKLSRGDLLCQLAEEASELAKAALKLRRAEDGKNPTPVTVEEAQENVVEEVADVMLVLDVLGIDPLSPKVDEIWTAKLARWSARIEGLTSE